MEEPINFDAYSENYENILNSQLKLFDGHEYFAEYKVKLLKEIFKNPLKEILEYGCGIGANLKWLSTYFPYANISGFDISEKSIEIAKKNCQDVDFFLLKKTI